MEKARALFSDLPHVLQGKEDESLLENEETGTGCALRYQPARIDESLEPTKEPAFSAHRSASFESARSIADPK